MTNHDWHPNLISPRTPLMEVLAALESFSAKIGLVVDEGRRLVGTVTDGDVRRGLLAGAQLSTPIEEIMHVNPVTAMHDAHAEHLLEVFERHLVRQLPLLDPVGRVVGLVTHDEISGETLYDNWVVLMAGGLGSRLRPLTDDTPKPLLKVGDKPILETILKDFVRHGFHRFFISVNYKAEQVMEHFGDGSRWGIEIRYIQETERLGTAGALSLLPDRPTQPVFVMNGDLLTKVNFRALLDFHNRQEARATMCVREYDLQVPYGVIRLEGAQIESIDEKPIQRFFINAGIYVLDPSCLDYIPQGQCYDMPSLFQVLARERQHTAAFPIHEYWMDIGRMEDFQRANAEYEARW